MVSYHRFTLPNLNNDFERRFGVFHYDINLGRTRRVQIANRQLQKTVSAFK